MRTGASVLPFYDAFQSVNVQPCPLGSYGRPMYDLVTESGTSLRKSHDLLWQVNGYFSSDSALQQRVSAQLMTYREIARQLLDKVQGQASTLLQQGDSVDPLHKAIAQIYAYSLALDHALKGALTEEESEALDNYFPRAQEIADYPSCASRAVTMTGLGCLLLGGVAAVGGIIATRFVDDVSEQHTIALAVEGGGIVSTILGVGMVAAQCMYRDCGAKQPGSNAGMSGMLWHSAERRLLEEVNAHVNTKVENV